MVHFWFCSLFISCWCNGGWPRFKREKTRRVRLTASQSEAGENPHSHLRSLSGDSLLIFRESPYCGRFSSYRLAAVAMLSNISPPAFCHHRTSLPPVPIRKQNFLVDWIP